MKNTIPQTIFDVVQSYPNKKALFYKKNGGYVGLSFREMRKQILQLSSFLLGIGVSEGDRVAILSANRPEWVVSDLAIMHIGGIVVPVHATLSPKIIKHILNDSGARVLIVNNQLQLNKVLLVERELPDLEKVVYMDIDNPGESREKNMVSWEEAIDLGKKQKLEPKNNPHHNDTATIVYTSGTTDMPKGVMLSHYNILSNVRAALDYIPVTHRDMLLSFLPLSHILERTAGYYAPLSRGASIAYAENSKTLPQNLKEVRPTILISVPRIFEKMFGAIWEKIKNGHSFMRKFFVWSLKQERGTWQHAIADKIIFRRIRALLGGRLRFTISGGASLNPKLGKFYEKMGIIILEGYGLTETSPVISVNTLDKKKFGSVGIPIIGTDVKISMNKEIVIRGPGVMSGYFHKKDKTLEVLDQYGWFRTGDMGFIDNKGFLYVTGRIKEMMVLSTGKNVWPEIIENALNADRFISQSMVIGHNRPYLTALIVPNFSDLQDYAKYKKISYEGLEDLFQKSEIRELFRERVDRALEDTAGHEKIADFILIKNEFEQKKDQLTPTLKLRRETIFERYKSSIEKLYRQ